MRCVAVYSEADRDAPHVRAADAAVCIGPAPAAESYLSIERILDACRRTAAQAVHPGYGFLSENPQFARACSEAGIVFVGPPVEAIIAMANKSAAKRRMQAAGVACIPGYSGEDQSDAKLKQEAGRIGYPLMIKAADGGGGRGMRRVEAPAHSARRWPRRARKANRRSARARFFSSARSMAHATWKCR